MVHYISAREFFNSSALISRLDFLEQLKDCFSEEDKRGIEAIIPPQQSQLTAEEAYSYLRDYFTSQQRTCPPPIKIGNIQLTTSNA